MSRIRSGVTLGNVMALVALFVALGGTGYAALKLPRNSVGAKQLKKNAVRSGKVRNGTLRRADFRGRRLPRGARGRRGLQGPRGFRGATGPRGGFRNVTAQWTRSPSNLAPGATQSYTVFCPAGQQGVAGGVRGDEFDADETTLSASRPVISESNQAAPATGGTFRGWQATVTNDTGSGIRPEVWVVCVPAP